MGELLFAGKPDTGLGAPGPGWILAAPWSARLTCAAVQGLVSLECDRGLSSVALWQGLWLSCWDGLGQGVWGLTFMQRELLQLLPVLTRA